MEVSRSRVERNYKITWLKELGAAAVARCPRAYELSEKAACWHRLHDPQFSLEPLLSEHQASQTKFSNISNQAGQLGQHTRKDGYKGDGQV